MMVDVVAWLAAVIVATWARFDFSLPGINVWVVFWLGLSAALLHVVIGYPLRVYRGRHVYGSFEQVLALVLSTTITSVLIIAVVQAWDTRPVPLSAVIAAGPLALLAMLGARYVVRLRREVHRRPGPDARPVLVLGAGDAGQQLVQSIQRDPRNPYRVVGLLDDNPRKRFLGLAGVSVLGSSRDLHEVADRRGATAVIVAIADAKADLLRRVSADARAAGLDVLTIPPLAELLDATVDFVHVRPLEVTDLLRRTPVTTDLADIRSLVHGRRVLITGAGGSIGSELSRQVHSFAPSALALLDRDESALHALQLAIHGEALLDGDESILGDIRDADRMRAIMTEFRPDVVFHAAALKHLPLLERFPAEALKTNVRGTVNVLEAALAASVSVFVNISTDKAAEPTSVLGYSKRITERLTAGAAAHGAGRFVSVRFGNVLGSRGSVLTSFSDQIAHGGPVTVTHRDVTRFFMTIPESVQLVLQAAAIGRSGEALVLEMGEPVRIDDVARQLIEHSGKSVRIVYTGLRAGEKLDEVLFGCDESPLSTAHPLVMSVAVPPLALDRMGALDSTLSGSDLVQALELLCIAPQADVREFVLSDDNDRVTRE